MAVAIGQLNRLVTVRKFIDYLDEKLVPRKALKETQSRYASVQEISNSYTLQQIRVTFSQAFQFSFREEPSLPIVPTDDFLYDGRQFTINSITRQDEGKKRFIVVVAYTRDKDGEYSVTPVMTNVQTEIHIKGNVVIGGSAYANWTGKIIAFRDGQQYTVKHDGSAQGKEVDYDSSTGLFSFPSSLPDLIDGEPVDVYFLP